MVNDHRADPLARRVADESADFDPFTRQDPEQIADQVAALPDVLRDALERYFATGRLPGHEYQGLSLADLEEFTGSPVRAVLWMGALIADEEAFWPTIGLRAGRFVIGDRDAHGAAREHSRDPEYAADVLATARRARVSTGTSRWPGCWSDCAASSTGRP